MIPRNTMIDDLITYYKERAQEYEKVYQKPERQSEIRYLENYLQKNLENKTVIEIACGTGYWTEKIARTARSIRASDINESVINIALTKIYKNTPIAFDVCDFYDLKEDQPMESLFGGFIFSHIPLLEINRFFSKINRLVQIGGNIILIDNNYVEGSSQPVTHSDNDGNTYQTRTLENGNEHKVLKNFPKEVDLRRFIQGKASKIHFTNLQYYWILQYTFSGK